MNWKAISKCLTLHYADKRDIRTLEYQIISLVQGNLTVQELYGQVYNQLSLILKKIGCMDLPDESLKLFTQSYRDKALYTFVRGLNGDLSRLLGMKEPADLSQACIYASSYKIKICDLIMLIEAKIFVTESLNIKIKDKT